MGLGPAPVQLGTSTDLAAVGSYVVLAKTGITNNIAGLTLVPGLYKWGTGARWGWSCRHLASTSTAGGAGRPLAARRHGGAWE